MVMLLLSWGKGNERESFDLFVAEWSNRSSASQ